MGRIIPPHALNSKQDFFHCAHVQSARLILAMPIQTNQTHIEESNNQERTHNRERPLIHLNKVDGMSVIQLNKREKGNMLVKYFEK